MRFVPFIGSLIAGFFPVAVAAAAELGRDRRFLAAFVRFP
jgi:hypothetical protein